ncbi:hypothetical protein [Mycolicibacterium sphagni]|uniref:Uncharacterized protein n=1 Tax=Mycolicibacterium sphagni TaxID=1786 RepID=A0A255DN56_9MYCO|nr:hypothetical protein [Mycolicibacterium sphagni]OYN77083.1 hypothetical protein CG716_19745 [Mycolicibacterium sphagni]
MSARKWWLVGGVIVAVVAVVTVFAIVKLTRHKPSDCDTVRAMMAYNVDFNQQVQRSANEGDPAGSTDADYQKWAARLHQYAGQIHDPKLSEIANGAAGLADQTVALVPQVRADSDNTASAPPRSVNEYSRVALQFRDDFAKLKSSCPA